MTQNAALCSAAEHDINIGMILARTEPRHNSMNRIPGRKSKPQRLSVTVTDSEQAKLQELAVRHHVSMAWLGRQAIIEFLDKYHSENRQLPLPLRESK